MRKFSIVANGYDPREVSAFIDEVITQVESYLGEIKNNQEKINHLESLLKNYNNMEETLNKAIIAAQNAADQMKQMAKNESVGIIEDAKRNANAIVNEALIQAEKTEFEANLLRKNISVFKNRIKNIIESQLELSDDLDKVEL